MTQMTQTLKDKVARPLPLSAAPDPAKVRTLTAYDKEVSFYLPLGGDPIQQMIRTSGTFFEQQMLAEVTALLPEAATVVDAGAHIGNHSLFFAAIAEAQVISFEPNPLACEIFEQTMTLNDSGARVELHRCALGAEAGRGSIEMAAPENLGSARVSIDAEGPIEIHTLDQVLADRHVDLIKVDVSGLQDRVLSGARGVLERCSPILLVEAATLPELTAIEALLRPFGYQKIRRYNDTPTLLFQKGMECPSGERSYTQTLLDRHLQALPETAGIYAGLATQVGNEAALRAAVTSLLPQVDGLFIDLQGHVEVPAFLTRFDKIKCRISSDEVGHGDTGRFWGMETLENAVYLTCDDSTLYPVDFSERLLQELAQTGGGAIIGVQGSLLLQPAETFDGPGTRSLFAATQDLVRRRRVHVVETSACAFHTKTVQMRAADFTPGEMADLALTRYAESHQIPRFAAPRRADWLLPIKTQRPAHRNATSGGQSAAKESCGTDTTGFASLLPLTLTRQKDRSEVHLVNLEKDENILSALQAIRPTDRDPVVILICDAITDRLRIMISQHKSRWEMHLVRRSEPLPSHCRDILAKKANDLRYWEVQNRRMQPAQPSGRMAQWIEGTLH